MAKLVLVKVEEVVENTDYSALTLYFEGEPTHEELVAAVYAEKGKRTNNVDPEDEYFEVSEHPDAVSEAANLRRFQATPLS